jgi:hypothetical protein
MNDAAKILDALQAGKKVQWASDATGWPRQHIVALVNGKGWTIDPERDTIRIPKNGTATAPEPTAAPSAPTPEPKPTAKAPPPLATDKNTEGINLEMLIRRGEQSGSTAIRAAAKKTRAAVEDLRQRIKAEDAEKQVRERIASLQQQLAAAQEQLRDVRPKKTTTPRPAVPDGIASKDVRAWAKERRIPCPTTGRIPKAVVDQYTAAHGLVSA